MNNDSQLDSLLRQMADDHRPDLPAPGLIWWRAQILRKQQEQARIERPVKIARTAAVVFCLAAMAALVAANREPVLELLAREGWALIPMGVLLVSLLVSASLLRSSAKSR